MPPAFQQHKHSHKSQAVLHHIFVFIPKETCDRPVSCPRAYVFTCHCSNRPTALLSEGYLRSLGFIDTLNLDMRYRRVDAPETSSYISWALQKVLQTWACVWLPCTDIDVHVLKYTYGSLSVWLHFTSPRKAVISQPLSQCSNQSRFISCYAIWGQASATFLETIWKSRENFLSYFFKEWKTKKVFRKYFIFV